jgi:hypothetical protein
MSEIQRSRPRIGQPYTAWQAEDCYVFILVPELDHDILDDLTLFGRERCHERGARSWQRDLLWHHVIAAAGLADDFREMLSAEEEVIGRLREF